VRIYRHGADYLPVSDSEECQVELHSLIQRGRRRHASCMTGCNTAARRRGTLTTYVCLTDALRHQLQHVCRNQRRPTEGHLATRGIACEGYNDVVELRLHQRRVPERQRRRLPNLNRTVPPKAICTRYIKYDMTDV